MISLLKKKKKKQKGRVQVWLRTGASHHYTATHSDTGGRSSSKLHPQPERDHDVEVQDKITCSVDWSPTPPPVGDSDNSPTQSMEQR